MAVAMNRLLQGGDEEAEKMIFTTQFASSRSLKILKSYAMSSTPLAAVLQSLLEKDVSTNPEMPYLGTVVATVALAEGPKELHNSASQLVLSIANIRRYRLELVQRGAIDQLLGLLSSNDKSTRMNAIEALAYLALEKTSLSDFFRSGASEKLLKQLQSSTSESDEVEELLRLLQCLLVSPMIRVQFVQQNGIAAMANVVFSGSDLQKERAAFVLWMLAVVPSLQSQFLSTKAIPALVLLLEDCSSDAADVALSALTLLAENDNCRAALVAHGVLAALPRLLTRDPRDEAAYRVGLLRDSLAASPHP